jgi:hypothetical protein
LVIASIGDVDGQLRDVTGPVSQIDLSAVDQMDTVGAWLVHRTAKFYAADITGCAKDAGRLINAVSGVDAADAVPRPHVSSLNHFLAEVGGGVVVGITTLLQFLGFVGQVVKAFFILMMNPGRFRWHAVVQHFDMVGVRALGIVGLMSCRPNWYDENHRRDRRHAHNWRCSSRGTGCAPRDSLRDYDALAWYLRILDVDYWRRHIVLDRLGYTARHFCSAVA